MNYHNITNVFFSIKHCKIFSQLVYQECQNVNNLGLKMKNFSCKSKKRRRSDKMIGPQLTVKEGRRIWLSALNDDLDRRIERKPLNPIRSRPSSIRLSNSRYVLQRIRTYWNSNSPNISFHYYTYNYLHDVHSVPSRVTNWNIRCFVKMYNF